jgi:hypothetical protein
VWPTNNNYELSSFMNNKLMGASKKNIWRVHLGTSVFLMEKLSCSNSLYMIPEVFSVFIYTQFCSFGLINSLNISLIHPLRKEQKIRG